MSVFVPTFLEYVGGMNKDVWTFNQCNTIQALQAVWNKVYKGCANDSRKRIKHLIEASGAVYNVVCQFMTLAITVSAKYS